ncbi:hypothetical protein KB13_1127 [beta proteobacterium KB13]|uniref:GtrA-like protein domain-containing protein n=1 Tax=beta proteobacterium KB13 TaxID=314607 RepID=B6BTH3_9PROT|nr:hypothetical protein KB13_1127 [beta proteobacterium KB13]
MYQLFLYKLKKNLFKSYLKAILSYSIIFLLNAVLLTLLLSYSYSIYVSQAITMLISSIFLYFLHNLFTFKN